MLLKLKRVEEGGIALKSMTGCWLRVAEAITPGATSPQEPVRLTWVEQPGEPV